VSDLWILILANNILLTGGESDGGALDVEHPGGIDDNCAVAWGFG